MIESGECTLQFAPSMIMEWIEGARDDTRGKEFAGFYCRAHNPIVEVNDALFYTIELVEETRRHYPGLAVQKVPKTNRLGEVLPEFLDLMRLLPKEEVKGDIGSAAPAPGDRKAIENWFHGCGKFCRLHPDRAHSRVTGWDEGVAETSRHYNQGNLRGVSQKAKMRWAYEQCFLRQILCAAAPEVDQKRLAQQFDFSRCEGCSLFLEAHWRYAKSRSTADPDPNDSDDWAQVPSISISDYALIERKLADFLCTGTPSAKHRIFYDPAAFVRALSV